MTVTVEVPEEIAAAIRQRGESVPDYLLRSAGSALEAHRPAATQEEKQRAIQELRTLADSLRGTVSLEEILEWKAEGRR